MEGWRDGEGDGWRGDGREGKGLPGNRPLQVLFYGRALSSRYHLITLPTDHDTT